MIDALLGRLTRRQREVVRLRFEEDLTQREIGERVGVSQMQVSRILRESIARLREIDPALATREAAASRARPHATAGAATHENVLDDRSTTWRMSLQGAGRPSWPQTVWSAWSGAAAPGGACRSTSRVARRQLRAGIDELLPDCPTMENMAGAVYGSA